GKTMLARRLRSLLPPMSMDEAVETTAIHSIAGLGRPAARFSLRPFRSPHHSASGAGLIGGGALPLPGEISLAHNGVLFLDELPEFAPHILNQLREPLEEGRLTISRAGGNLTFPSRFVLVAAMNPCPCGFYASGVQECSCSPSSVVRYRSRVSGPLLDRIDLHVNLLPVDFSEFSTTPSGENSEVVRTRVNRALERRAARDGSDIPTNAEASRLLARAVPRMALTMRALKRILAVASTIADLADRDEIESPHLAEALQYRSTLHPPDQRLDAKGSLHLP
ncbi:MAG: ATP-binding protein, partial [Candidatus Binatia bacterium]